MVSAKRYWLVALVLGLCTTLTEAGQTPTARVDRTTVHEGETLRLSVEADGRQRPDFDVLGPDFDVLGTSRSSRITMLNGRMEARTEWVATLAPNRTGDLTVPPIPVGSEATAPIRIQVRPATAGNKDRDVFVEVDVKPQRVYVQEQIRYTIRLFHAVDIHQGGLSAPQAPDTVVERIGDDIDYSVERHGRHYQVTERRYAIFPQTSGQLRLPGTEFAGQVAELGGGGGGNDPFARFFSDPSTRPIRLRTPPRTLRVSPKPPAADGDWWLPAEMVRLRQSWAPDDPPRFHVGEPITRTLTIEATGITGEQLPALEPPAVAGLKAYPDKPEVDTRTDGGSLVGVRREKHALVATAPGKITLPPVQVRWWDTRRDRQQVATIPATTVQVLPAAAGNGRSAPAAPSAAASGAPPDPASVSTVVPVRPSAVSWWRRHGGVLAWVFLAAWLITATAWAISAWVRRRPPRSPANARATGLKDARHRLKWACQAHDPVEARHALLAWAESRWGEGRPPGLHGIARRLHSAALAEAIDGLEQALYRDGAGGWDGEALWRAFENTRRRRERAGVEADSTSLPELYPSGQ